MQDVDISSFIITNIRFYDGAINATEMRFSRQNIFIRMCLVGNSCYIFFDKNEQITLCGRLWMARVLEHETGMTFVHLCILLCAPNEYIYDVACK